MILVTKGINYDQCHTFSILSIPRWHLSRIKLSSLWILYPGRWSKCFSMTPLIKTSMFRHPVCKRIRISFCSGCSGSSRYFQWYFQGYSFKDLLSIPPMTLQRFPLRIPSTMASLDPFAVHLRFRLGVDHHDLRDAVARVPGASAMAALDVEGLSNSILCLWCSIGHIDMWWSGEKDMIYIM